MYHPEYYSRDISSFNLEDGTKCVRGAINVLFLNSNYFLDPPTSTSILPKNGSKDFLVFQENYKYEDLSVAIVAVIFYFICVNLLIKVIYLYFIYLYSIFNDEMNPPYVEIFIDPFQRYDEAHISNRVSTENASLRNLQNIHVSGNGQKVVQIVISSSDIYRLVDKI